MAVSIKNKIRLGTLFLLLLLLISGGVSVYFQASLSSAPKNVLADNYESLQFCEEMQRQLDSLAVNSAPAVLPFEAALSNQEKNITEPGEAGATAAVRKAYTSWKTGHNNGALTAVRSGIDSIFSLNMHAIERKNDHAKKTAETAYAIIIVVVSVSFIIGITFAFNFPSVVSSPIKKLTEAISEISVKNYRYRIHLSRQDEFGDLAQAFNTMSERLESFENSNLNKLIFEKARAEAVINSLQDASIGIDKNEKILFINKQALQLLTLKPEEATGKNVKEVAGRNDLFRFLIESDSTAPFKIIVEGKENYYTKESIDVQQEDATSRVIVVKNITSFKEMDVAKTNFIATVSHELKTPLAASDFSLKLLEDTRVGVLSAEQRELVTQLKNDNRRMLRILSELLNMSQVEAGRIQLQLQPVSVYDMADASISAVAVAAKEKDIIITTHVPPGLPQVMADADKAGWVLNNFFTNAIKHSARGSAVSLEVSEKGDTVAFAVTDHGTGIDAAYLGRIFERYYQVPGRSELKGSGIGLAICKEFIEAMNGTVSVSSEPGRGSVFSFSLKTAT